MAAAIVPPLEITGPHALPTWSSSNPNNAIAPTIKRAAAATSTITRSPIPKVLAREPSLLANPKEEVLRTSVAPLVASVAVFT